MKRNVLTLQEFLSALRELGQPAGYHRVRQEIIDGVYPFAHAVKLKQWAFRIDRIGFEKWAEQYHQD